MSKTTYRNLVTIPGSDTDSVSDGETIGGDIVANFKAIADRIRPDAQGAVLVGGGNQPNQELYASGTVEHGVGTHLLNNNIAGYIPGGPLWNSASNAVGVGSGAFMKGILTSLDSSVCCLNVPYAGAMIVRYEVIALDGENQHFMTGTLRIYGGSWGVITPTDTGGDTEFGYFEVNNGDLYFTKKTSPYYFVNVAQIGLHGTILSGSGNDIGSGQQGSLGPAYSDDSSSSY